MAASSSRCLLRCARTCTAAVCKGARTRRFCFGDSLSTTTSSRSYGHVWAWDWGIEASALALALGATGRPAGRNASLAIDEMHGHATTTHEFPILLRFVSLAPCGLLFLENIILTKFGHLGGILHSITFKRRTQVHGRKVVARTQASGTPNNGRLANERIRCQGAISPRFRHLSYCHL